MTYEITLVIDTDDAKQETDIDLIQADIVRIADQINLEMGHHVGYQGFVIRQVIPITRVSP